MTKFLTIWFAAVMIGLVYLGVQTEIDHVRLEAWGQCFDAWHDYNQRHFPLSSLEWNARNGCKI